MSTRPAPVGFLGNRRLAGPVYRSIIAVDLEGSTTRTDPEKGELRRVMYELLGRSLEAVAITRGHLEPLADRGDGVIILVRPDDEVPKTALLDRLIPLLTALLAEYNAQVARPTLRIRLRAVVHAGDVNMDRQGFYGEAIDVAIRLLDAPAVKRTLKRAAAPLVLVISDEIYSGIVRHGYVDARSYRPVAGVQVARRRHRGWVHVPDSAALPGVGSAPAGRSASIPRPSVLATADERMERQVALIIGRAGQDRGKPAAG
jgi:hypothetical protein